MLRSPLPRIPLPDVAGRDRRDRSLTRSTVLGFLIAIVAVVLLSAGTASASEADLAIPDLHAGTFNIAGKTITAWNLLFYGALVITGTLGISLYLRRQINKLPAHKSMLDVSDIIY
jgi:K(+)-stimulated pyrophosphate-energized sodium pump